MLFLCQACGDAVAKPLLAAGRDDRKELGADLLGIQSQVVQLARALHLSLIHI